MNGTERNDKTDKTGNTDKTHATDPQCLGSKLALRSTILLNALYRLSFWEVKLH